MHAYCDRLGSRAFLEGEQRIQQRQFDESGEVR